ncbi:DUF2510 domain-containing protein [Agrococcus sp. SGAir0287]|uniref:DUF2510 domain-containing protein n=1 Tax=Agrococcus sp. SGAir0287 TaxID=2070347 RepID=UPI001585F875|nr:DUF2510 domain-containing protein [Agrococcus sp. SGAir0287]
MSSTTPAGWYPDPEREGATRWWDGTQWAPSQEPAASDDRFKPKDAAATDAGAADASSAASTEQSWSPEPSAASSTGWDGQPSTDASAASWSPTPSTPAASAPSWQQQETPSWQQPAGQAWGQQEAQPTYGAPQDFSQAGTQQWNQYDQQPRKSRKGLVIGLVAGGLVLVLLLVVGGGLLVTNLISNATQQTQTQGGGGGGTGGGAQGPGSWQVQVAEGGAPSVTQFEITTDGTYEISVAATNGADPRITLTGNGQTWEDDDSGEGVDSLLEVPLTAGTYTLSVEEYFGDALTATVTVTQR